MGKLRLSMLALVAGAALALAPKPAWATCAQYMTSGPNDDPINCWWTGNTDDAGQLGFYECSDHISRAFFCQI